jgi:antitoxin VapB
MPGHRPSRSRQHATGSPRLRATILRNGTSQAVRIPAALRLDCDQVTIRREGAALVIEPVGADGWPAGYVAAIEAGSTLVRAPQPTMPSIRRLDEQGSRPLG